MSHRATWAAGASLGSGVPLQLRIKGSAWGITRGGTLANVRARSARANRREPLEEMRVFISTSHQKRKVTAQ